MKMFRKPKRRTWVTFAIGVLVAVALHLGLPRGLVVPIGDAIGAVVGDLVDTDGAVDAAGAATATAD